MGEEGFLVVGLGNVGTAYEQTRHNIGFQAVRCFGEKMGWAFRHKEQLSGEIAQGSLQGKRVFLLLPTTFVNRSGHAVRLCKEYFEIPHERVCVVCDDIYLPLGTLRVREKGASGGHNGLKSIEEHLGTQLYPRLRIGVGDREQGDLADHVLGKFPAEERAQLPQILSRAVFAIEAWMLGGCAAAAQAIESASKKQE